jgi:hypothetical protein
MSFVIQVGNPIVLDRHTVVAADVADALQRIFPMDTEAAILIWNRVPVRLSYKYDVSVIIDDVLPMIDAVLSSPSGAYQAGWGSNSFNGRWTLHWGAGSIALYATWLSVTGDYEDLLTSRSSLTIARNAFLREWQSLLSTVARALERSGIQITDQAGRQTLERIAAALPGPGVLYQPTEPVAPSG